MKTEKPKINAVDIFRSRYIGDDPGKLASLEAERLNAQVARMVYTIRKEADLTQKGLADLVNTTQSVISRLEDADYEGHSLSMLARIAGALGRRLTVSMTPFGADAEAMWPGGPSACKTRRAARPTA